MTKIRPLAFLCKDSVDPKVQHYIEMLYEGQDNLSLNCEKREIIARIPGTVGQIGYEFLPISHPLQLKGIQLMGFHIVDAGWLTELAKVRLVTIYEAMTVVQLNWMRMRYRSK